MEKITVKVSYKPLWKLLSDREISKVDLRNETGIAASTFTKMKNDQFVSLDVLSRIAIALECGLDEIVEIKHKKRGLR